VPAPITHETVKTKFAEAKGTRFACRRFGSGKSADCRRAHPQHGNDAMVGVANQRPLTDRFQVITEHAAEDPIADGADLGITRAKAADSFNSL
jgi:hypothetical protein